MLGVVAMKQLVKRVCIVNILAGFVVLVLSQYISAFATTSLSDYLFYTCIIIWGIAGLTWEGSRASTDWEVEQATRKTRQMVSGHDFTSDFQQQKRQNYQFGMMMFVAGIPPLLGCILLYVFS